MSLKRTVDFISDFYVRLGRLVGAPIGFGVFIWTNISLYVFGDSLVCAHWFWRVYMNQSSLLLSAGDCFYAHHHRRRDRRRRGRTRRAPAGETERHSVRPRLAPAAPIVPRIASDEHEDLSRTDSVL